MEWIWARFYVLVFLQKFGGLFCFVLFWVEACLSRNGICFHNTTDRGTQASPSHQAVSVFRGVWFLVCTFSLGGAMTRSVVDCDVRVSNRRREFSVSVCAFPLNSSGE
ncbi:unnamed protein product [Hapterophycus canaliculatus]